MFNENDHRRATNDILSTDETDFASRYALAAIRSVYTRHSRLLRVKQRSTPCNPREVY